MEQARVGATGGSGLARKAARGRASEHTSRRGSSRGRYVGRVTSRGEATRLRVGSGFGGRLRRWARTFDDAALAGGRRWIGQTTAEMLRVRAVAAAA